MRPLAYLMLSFVLLGLVSFTPRTHAESDCDPVSGDAQGQATGPATFVATVKLVVGGQSLTATSTATLLEQRQVGDGTILVTTSHVFEISGSSDGDGQCEAGENCFTTLDRAVVSPTDTSGPFRL